MPTDRHKGIKKRVLKLPYNFISLFYLMGSNSLIEIDFYLGHFSVRFEGETSKGI